MQRNAFFPKAASVLISALGLALALWLGLSASAAPPAADLSGLENLTGLAPPDPSGLPETWNPGVVTYTFDADNMGWRSRDIYNNFAPAPWSGGAISQRFTNRGGSEPENFAVFESPRLDPALSGASGSISFTHNKSGTMVGQVLYSVCLRFSTPSVIPAGTLPCTPWRAMSPGPVTIPLTTEGGWGVYEYISIPFYPPYAGTPLTEEQIKEILKAFRYVDVHYITLTSLCPSPQASCLTNATIALDDVRLEVTGISGKLNASTPYLMEGDAVLFYATIKDSLRGAIKGSNQVTMTLGDSHSRWNLWDRADTGDLRPGDGVYSAWLLPTGAGPQEARLYYGGDEVATTTITITQHPHLAVLTDIQALYDQFLNTGMTPDEDDDNDEENDFYQMLGRLNRYAAGYKGLVYDVRESIDTRHGFPVNYANLAFAGDDPATNRIRMAKLIDEALARMHQASGHTIGDVAIIGADDVIPFYRIEDASGRNIGLAPGIDTPTAADLAAGYIVTDVPYGTVDYVNQDAVTRPSPQIPVGRVTAGIPMGMIERLDGYDKPVMLDPREASAALFIPADDRVHWDWLDRNLWTPIFTRHYALRDDRTAPPFGAGYYRYNGTLVKWDSADVLTALGATGLTVLATHGFNRCDLTMEPGWICGTDYGTLARAGGRLYVIEATLSGFSPAFYSPTGSRGAFNDAIPRWLQHAHRTQVGTTWLSVGYNETVGLTDYLMSTFVTQALDGSSATVGDAFVRAWNGYWTSTGADTPTGRSVSYGMILWGLPTEVIQHGSPSVIQASTKLAYGTTDETVAQAGSLRTMPALDRSFTVEVNVPNFQVDTDASGALLVRPANGGTTYAEGPDLPLLPQVVKRFILPPAASEVQVMEDTFARIPQSYGAARLQTAQLHADCDGECSIGASAASAAITGTYPSRAFDTEIQQRLDATILTLAAVPAQYAPDGQLTLFTKMKFTVSYTLSAAPAAAITGLTINSGQPVRAGTASVPLAVNVTSSAARPITITYQIGDPSGFTLAGGQATANLPQAASQVNLTLNAERWSPGPKSLSVSIADSTGTLDATSADVLVLGVRAEASLGQIRVPRGRDAQLTLLVWDENGAPAGGLSGRITIRLDGVARPITMTEGPTGRYAGTLTTTGLSDGLHQVVCEVTDGRGLGTQALAEFVISDNLTYLPLTLRRR